MVFVNAHNVLPISEMLLIKSYGISPSYKILNTARLQQEMSIKRIFCLKKSSCYVYSQVFMKKQNIVFTLY